MAGHKVFISYSHDLLEVAKKICDFLEASGIKCWYAPRDVIGDYATAITTAIDEAKIFVVILNNEASKSPHVLNEVEIAYKSLIEERKEVFIIPFVGKDKNLSKAMEYYIKRMHWVDAGDQGVDNAIIELRTKISSLIDPKKDKEKVERAHTSKYATNDEAENKRLKLQHEILQKFDGNIFDNVSKEFDELNILDVGCHHGDYVNQLFGNQPNLKNIIGIDYNAEFAKIAQEKHGSEKQHYYNVKVEENLDELMPKILEENGLEGFNIIHVSMMLMHLAKPGDVLKKLRKYLVRGGYILIKDIDDGLNLAFPDEEGYFADAMDYCLKDPYSGYRNNGREIPYMLHHAGFKDIKLLKSSLDTTTLDFDQREALFDSYFGMIYRDYEIYSLDKEDKRFDEGYKFFKEHIEEMKDEFVEDEFFFNFGYIQYIARR